METDEKDVSNEELNKAKELLAIHDQTFRELVPIVAAQGRAIEQLVKAVNSQGMALKRVIQNGIAH